MKTKIFVVIESGYIDSENHGSYPIGTYSTQELAEAAIEQARLRKNSEQYEEFLEEYANADSDDDHFCDYYTNDGVEYSWIIKEFVLDGTEQ